MINNILIDISENSIFLISSIGAVLVLCLLLYGTRKTTVTRMLLFESPKNIVRLSLLFTKILFMVRILLFTDNVNVSYVFIIIIMDALYNFLDLKLSSVAFDYGATLLFVLIKAVSIVVIQFSVLNDNSWVAIIAYVFTYSYLSMQIIFVLLTKLNHIKSSPKLEFYEEKEKEEGENEKNTCNTDSM